MNANSALVGFMFVASVLVTVAPAQALPLSVCVSINATCTGEANPTCKTSTDCVLPGLSVCDEGHGRCVAPCTGDLGVAVLGVACADVSRPACNATGPLAGQCSACSAQNASACVGLATGSTCVAEVGNCGCYTDADCLGTTCDVRAHVCVPPLGGGVGGSSSGGVGASSSGGVGASSSGGVGASSSGGVGASSSGGVGASSSGGVGASSSGGVGGSSSGGVGASSSGGVGGSSSGGAPGGAEDIVGGSHRASGGAHASLEAEANPGAPSAVDVGGGADVVGGGGCRAAGGSGLLFGLSGPWLAAMGLVLGRILRRR